MAEIFGENFVVSVSPEIKHGKSSKIFGENSEQNSGQNSGGKFKNSGDFRSAKFLRK